jgi:hypothetical protein
VPFELLVVQAFACSIEANPSVNSRGMQNLNALFGVAYRERR